MKTPSNNSAAPGPRSDAPSASHNASLTSRIAEPVELIPAIERPDVKDPDQIESQPVGIPHSLFDIEEGCHAPL